ncbi:MAG: hypothetical protein ACXAD7_00045 [Candidatus Kariarchaeaceae archaeon]|jgi:hypothetical protein
MYIAKIAGSRYLVSLESDQGQWFLRMKLDDVVEAEVGVTHMTKRALHTNLGTLFGKVNVQVNSFQHDLLHKEIVAQITHLLARDQEEGVPTIVAEPLEDPRVGELMKRVEKLEATIDTLEERIGRVENLSSS